MFGDLEEYCPLIRWEIVEKKGVSLPRGADQRLDLGPPARVEREPHGAAVVGVVELDRKASAAGGIERKT
jgi:hypothetical protein